MYPRLSSISADQVDGVGLQERSQIQTITPLHQQPKETEKEIDIKEYVDMQDNKVVAYVINWIKSTFVKELMKYLNTEFKQSIVNEIKK